MLLIYITDWQTVPATDTDIDTIIALWRLVDWIYIFADWVNDWVTVIGLDINIFPGFF